MPDSGRQLQSGSCSYKWHYKPALILEKIKKNNDDNENIKKKTNESTSKQKIINDITENEKDLPVSEDDNLPEKKSIGFLSFFLVIIITLIALIVLTDTLKFYLSSFIPNIDIYLSSLYESLTDIFLFFKDLIK